MKKEITSDFIIQIDKKCSFPPNNGEKPCFGLYNPKTQRHFWYVRGCVKEKRGKINSQKIFISETWYKDDCKWRIRMELTMLIIREVFVGGFNGAGREYFPTPYTPLKLFPIPISHLRQFFQSVCTLTYPHSLHRAPST